MKALDRELIRASRPARAHLATTVALGAAAAALTVLQAVLLAHVITAAFLDGAAPESLAGALVALVAVGLGRGLVAAGFEVSGRVGAARVMSGLRRGLVGRLAHGRPGGPPRAPAGALAAAAVQGVDALEDYFARYLPQVVLAALLPVAILAYVVALDPVVAGILALTVPLIVLFMALIGRGSAALASARWRTLSALAGHFLDVVDGLETLRAHVRTDAQTRSLADVGDRLRRETMATLRVAFLSALVLELLAMLGTALAAVTIGLQLVDGAIGLQTGLTVLLLAPELYLPLRQLGASYHAAEEGAAAAHTLLDAAPESPARARRGGLPSTAPHPGREPVRFELVSVTYPGREAPALDQADLGLAPGQLLLLTGPSGAGKSTLAALLLRLLDPDVGRITCGGVDLAAVDIAAWRSRVAWLPQQPTIFAGSVVDNVRLAVPGAARRRVWDALRTAQVDDLVAGLPRGLDTPVGEGGRALSAGQAHRLALARALLPDAPLLVLDEPTAHLDEESAAAVGSALAAAARDRTTLLIAHRAALAADAHSVAELRDGRIRIVRPDARPSSRATVAAA